MRGIVGILTVIGVTFNCFGDQRTLIVKDDYPTVQQAIDAALDGDTVEIKAGIYEESLTFKDGINIKGASRDAVIICCNAKAGSVIRVINCGKGSISNLTFRHTGTENLTKEDKTLFPVVQLDTSSIRVALCTIENGSSHGITIAGKCNCEISECIIQKNASSGIFVSNEGAAPVLKDNQCKNNGANGIWFMNAAGGTAERNSCEENIYNGICVTDKKTRVNLKSNRCIKNGVSGIYFGQGANGTAEDNICNENQWHGISVADNLSAPILMRSRCCYNKRAGIYASKETRARSRVSTLEGNGEISFLYIRELLSRRRFDELEEIATRLRKEKSRFTNGNWQLNHFYRSLQENWSDREEKYLLGVLEEWIKEKPDSVTPRIAMAGAYVESAWRARGGGWASEVTEEGWKVFHEKLGKAWDVLKKAEKLNVNDPGLYCVFIQAGMGLNKPKSEMDTLFEKGISIERAYYPLYCHRALDLLPRWGGEKGELALFANKSVTLTADQEGEKVYAVIAADIASFMVDPNDPNEFFDLGLSYPQIKRGHAEILKQYPEATYYLNTYCFIASIYKDKEVARELFDKIGNNWDEYVWQKEVHFKKYQNWVYGTDSSPNK